MPKLGIIDVEIYDTKDDSWAQAKYLVHGYDDVLWTDDPEQAAIFVRESIELLNRRTDGVESQ